MGGVGERAGMEDGQGVLSSVSRAASTEPGSSQGRHAAAKDTHAGGSFHLAGLRPAVEMDQLWDAATTPGQNHNPWGGDFFVLVNPRERDAAEATGSLLQVPGGVQALLRQREMPLPRGREGSGLCVSHCQRGRGGDTMPVLLL